MSVPLQKSACVGWVERGRSVLRRGAALLLDLVVDRRLHLGEQLLGLLELGTVRAGPLLLELLGVVALPVRLEGLDLLVDLGDELLDGLRLLLQDVALGVDLIVVHSEPSHDLLLCLCSPDRFGKFSSGPTVQARAVRNSSTFDTFGRFVRRAAFVDMQKPMSAFRGCRWGALPTATHRESPNPPASDPGVS